MSDFDWVDNTNDDGRLRAEVKRLRVRIDELLVTVRKLSTEAPYPEEAGNAAVLIAEVGTLKAKLAEAVRERDEARRAGAWKPSEVWREEVADETAEAIAAWLDDSHVGRDDDPNDIAATVRDDIRAGAWRKEKP